MPNLFKRIFSRTPMARSTRAYDFALEHLALPDRPVDARPLILDVGTGKGNGTAYLSRRLPDAQIVTLDISPDSLNRDGLTFGPRQPFFIQATAPSPPLATASLDAVLLIMTFHCLPEPQPVISEAARMLKPGGALMIADVDGHHWMARPFEWVEHLFISPLTHAYTPEELETLFTAAGLNDFTVHRRPGKEKGFMVWATACKRTDTDGS